MNIKNVIIKDKVFEVIEGTFADDILFDNLLKMPVDVKDALYPTLYQCYKNPCKKKILRYSSNALYIKRLALDNSGYSKNIGILKYNDRTFIQRFILELENHHYIIDLGYVKNTIICSTNYKEAIDKLKNL